ncbi:MAG: 2Fe-2S iron-sulfur cluster-binding protein [Pseudomonadota bacterium]|jgi:2Fe-2S ferredoxin
MAKLVIVDRVGDERTIDAKVGLSIMDVLRANGFDELLALCGGCCSCATCHVYVDPTYASALPVVGGDENALLESSGARTTASRLSCQLKMIDAFDGMRLTIAPED